MQHRWRSYRARLHGAAAIMLSTAMIYTPFAQAQLATTLNRDRETTTPIKHIILIIGENRSFDHVFATYTPKSGDGIANLLSKGIVKADGTPGRNYGLAEQNSATVTGTYSISPTEKQPYTVLPPAMTDGAPSAASNSRLSPPSPRLRQSRM